MRHLHYFYTAVCLLFAGMLLAACSDSDDGANVDTYKWETFEHQERMCWGPPTYHMFVMDRCAYRHLKKAFSGQWHVGMVLVDGRWQIQSQIASVTYEPGKSITIVSRDGTTTTVNVTSEKYSDGLYRISASDSYSFYIREGEMSYYHDAEKDITTGQVDVGLRIRVNGKTVEDVMLYKDINEDEVKWYKQNLYYKEITIWACSCTMLFGYDQTI